MSPVSAELTGRRWRCLLTPCDPAIWHLGDYSAFLNHYEREHRLPGEVS